eukprot:TRINITY_DN106975_c0_g1_i1.p1 TRINITY_DN106975_c0_g1~~TRINITY_DN106975_c0_g1_i1.p1  ORF type:complete len:871 (+),score=127.77 TRINITY_DN106975_c0_g1_i1:364-2613(+)
MVEKARDLVLEMFRVSRETHTAVFTGGVTHGLHLLGENFSWGDGVFLYADESHTSVVGLRQFARKAKQPFGTFATEDLPRLAEELGAAQALGPALQSGRGPNLIAFPGESNFSGSRTDLSCIKALREGPLRWRVLLDAAKLACSPGALDLSVCPADFVVVSFYKMFGYPTGLGALIVRHDASPLLQPRADLAEGPSGPFGPAYFAGGCVSAISATSTFAVPRPSLSEWLERGTVHYLGIAALPSQLQALRRLAPDALRCRHALAVCREAFLRTSRLRHSNGRRLCTIFGRHEEVQWSELQGPTLALLLWHSDGSPVPYGIVAELADAKRIVLRTGCHCSAGSCQRYLGLTDGDLRQFFASGKVCGDDKGIVDGRPTGVVRISFGAYSTLSDVTSWVAMLSEFIDTLPDHQEMPAENLAPAVAIPRPLPPCVPSDGRSGIIVGLKVYPVKGCGPLRVRRWPLDPATGTLLLDRRWCIALDGSRVSNAARSTKARLRPVSAKQAPRLTTVRLTLRQEQDGCFVLVLSAKTREGCVELPLSQRDCDLLRSSGAELEPEAEAPAGCRGSTDEVDAAGWFEELLEIRGLRLAVATAGKDAAAGTGEAPAVPGSSRDFANAPNTLLLVSTASLREFGRLCGLAVPANRFRANVEVDFKEPYEEAEWPVGLPLRLDEAGFEAAGHCVRCQAVDIDPDDAAASGPSLLAALATLQANGGGGKGPTFGVLLRPRLAVAEGQADEAVHVLRVAASVQRG